MLIYGSIRYTYYATPAELRVQSKRLNRAFEYRNTYLELEYGYNDRIFDNRPFK